MSSTPRTDALKKSDATSLPWKYSQALLQLEACEVELAEAKLGPHAMELQSLDRAISKLEQQSREKDKLIEKLVERVKEFRNVAYYPPVECSDFIKKRYLEEDKKLDKVLDEALSLAHSKGYGKDKQ